MFEDCGGVGAARGGCANYSGPRLSKIWSSQRRCILKVSRPVDVVAPRSLARSRWGHAVRVCESVLSRCNYTGALHDKGADVEDVMVVGVLCDGRPLAAELRVQAACRILIGTTPISSTIDSYDKLASAALRLALRAGKKSVALAVPPVGVTTTFGWPRRRTKTRRDIQGLFITIGFIHSQWPRARR